MKQQLHPWTFWALFIALASGVVISNSSISAIAALLIAALVVLRYKQDGPWGASFKWSLYAGIYLLVIRTLAAVLIGVPRPGTTLFTVPRLSLPSWLPGIRIGGDVTLERLSSSLHEALIIATVIALFGAANSVTSPHKLLRTFPAYIYQLSVALTIATSVFPQLVTSIGRIRKAQMMRNGKRARLSTIALPLLEESLTRAVHLAESMESRGYGRSRKKSRYRPVSFHRTDSLFLIFGICSAIAMVTQ